MAVTDPTGTRKRRFDAPRSWLRSVRPEKGTLRGEMLAGLPGAIGSVPDGMAASVLVGVSPIYGLYASALGPVGGGLFASTRLMVITTTSAAALAAGSALSAVNSSDRPEALFLLTVIAGAVMVAAGLLHLGRYTRFVSHSVMIGFLSGIGVNIILGQVPDLLGVSASGSFAAEKAVNALAHPSQVDVASLLVGLSALGIIAVISHTRLRSVAAVVALVVPSLVVIVAGLDTVARVSSAGAIPKGIPLPHLPKLSDLSLSVVTGALAVAVIVLVQGAGVAESALNPDGSLSDANRDFVAQGVGNLASGFFRGQPVGGSVGQTALNVAAGAKTRWASIWSGLWMIAILAAFSGVVAKVALPTLSAVLIYAAFGSLRFGEMATIFRTGRNLPGGHHHDLRSHPVLTGSHRRRHWSCPLPATSAQPGGARPCRGRSGHPAGRPLGGTSGARPREGRFGHRTQRAREPLLRRGAYAAGPAARPRRRRPPRGSAAPARPNQPWRHLFPCAG